MTDIPDEKKGAMAKASRQLARLHEQAAQARAVLARLQEEVLLAENRLSKDQSAELIEANEQLVLSMIGVMTHAVDIGQKLKDVSHAFERDPLTELPNRVLLLDRFTRAIANAKRRNTRLALMFVDLDHFKQINDTLGHAVGDEVLKLVANCLSSAVRDADTVSRHGGDEFLVLLTEVSQPSDAALVAEKIIAALAAAWQVKDYGLEITASIGISIYPDDGIEADMLIARADAAMYHTKKLGQGGFAFHGKAPIAHCKPDLLIPDWLLPPGIDYELEPAASGGLNAQLREANEQLVRAALSAQELHAAAEQAQRRQLELLAVVAHELRNPLTPIRTAAALLGRVATEEPLLPRLQAIIERQVIHMTRLVGDLLDLSRVNNDKLRIERQSVDMVGVIDTAVDSCRAAMSKRSQNFSLRMPAHVLAVDGDPVRLAQIVSNLLDNASKYTPDNGEISLSVIVVDNAIVIIVTDNGIGIPAEALPRIFEPFMQDAQAIGFNGVGLGIGLTVVRELVEAHGGNVVARSEGSGLGSLFVVTLPLIEPGLAHTARSEVYGM